ncbi:hypothetical protein EDEG_00956 [Edhazardia aedis USNM 41457]|uniref:Uncharacterized protein n=1 Tax=Edhazardia aedis (strain USNM 41457) TaxID=1003232 RepID=J8ZYV7_EDHAE|nr:hypothetical protein EDEG_00956 [Edhazardia aedis USNM 41457]|eukprot:EJW04863.1 hypothetical protein EDEG_00956 [Edhazardia aedis USNM 41457]
MNVWEKEHEHHDNYYKIEGKNKEVPGIFEKIPFEYVLQNKNRFNKIFRYVGNSEYELLKKYQCVKGFKHFVKNFYVPINDEKMWTTLIFKKSEEFGGLEIFYFYVRSKGSRLAKIELCKCSDNREICKQMIMRLQYPGFVMNYPEDIYNTKTLEGYKFCIFKGFNFSYVFKEKTNDIKELLKLACNDFKYLEKLVMDNNFAKPYIIKYILYNKYKDIVLLDSKSPEICSTTVKNDVNFELEKSNKHSYKNNLNTCFNCANLTLPITIKQKIDLIHASNPCLYTHIILEKKIPLLYLQEEIDPHILNILDDDNVLNYLFLRHTKETTENLIKPLKLCKRYIKNIKNFIFNNVSCSSEVSNFLSKMVPFLDKMSTWFDIFFDKSINYKDYCKFFENIYYINTNIQFDVERIGYFMQYEFF